MNRISLALLFAVTGCGVGSADVSTPDDTLSTDEAQLAGDASDHSCQVILRTAGRPAGTTGGFETKCTSAGCYYVWEGFLDVASTVPATAKAYVLFRSIDQTAWTKKLATKVTGGPAGYQRWKFRLEPTSISPGMSPTSLQRAKIEVAPYLLLNNARVFDHNRIPGALDAYTLNVNNSWSIADDAAVCRPAGLNRATLDFQSGWRQEQHGALVANGKGVITYDLNRLPSCRGTHNGYPAWDITATVRFSPGGQQVESSVRAFNSPNGVPDVSTMHSTPFEFTIPAGATSADVWFVNTGLWCSPTYDSNQGNNYHFAVVAPPPAISWFGNPRSSTSRECVANQSVPEPIVLDGYIRERACSFIEEQVYVPGVTDVEAQHPEFVLAQAEIMLDGVAQPNQWLSFQGRTGNDFKYRFDLPRDVLWYGSKWTTLQYTMAFSTDGVIWKRELQHTVRRDVTWCNPSWSSCAL
jgi:hypothetical protein